MPELTSRIHCPEHPDAREAFICEHLLVNPAQVWCSAKPTPDALCPDAWCVRCDEAFQRFEEWNEENEAVLSIQLICSGCYLRLRSNSLTPL
jgi:hypothetical protein